MSKIKICGIRRKEDINYVNESNPDYIGFVFAKSKRQVSDDEVMRLRDALNKEITPVGVFVNEDIYRVAALLNNEIIDIAQLHGDETPEYISSLRQLMQRGELIKAVRVANRQDIPNIDYADVDYLLFDTYAKEAYGGTGKVFDWSLINNAGKPFFLAGGINGDNVEAALCQVKPFAIDVSSAVEMDGYKDREKILDIVGRMRDADK